MPCSNTKDQELLYPLQLAPTVGPAEVDSSPIVPLGYVRPLRWHKNPRGGRRSFGAGRVKQMIPAQFQCSERARTTKAQRVSGTRSFKLW